VSYSLFSELPLSLISETHRSLLRSRDVSHYWRVLNVIIDLKHGG